VADLDRDHGLRAGREGGVADGQGLVVGEVAGLDLGAEGVAAQVQRQHEVRLLDDLLAVQVEVGEVQEQRVLVGSGAREIPGLMLGEGLRLGMNAQLLVVGDDDRRCGVPPAGCLLRVDAELGCAIGVPLDGVCRQPQVPLRHQIGVDVVVCDGAVLVGPGDPSMRNRPSAS
jgi:hypothetical protein